MNVCLKARDPQGEPLDADTRQWVSLAQITRYRATELAAEAQGTL